jgi:hypothetical protein
VLPRPHAFTAWSKSASSAGPALAADDKVAEISQGAEAEVSSRRNKSLAVLLDEVDRPLIAVHEVHHDAVHDGSLEQMKRGPVALSCGDFEHYNR